jgi:hypothetical protein
MRGQMLGLVLTDPGKHEPGFPVDELAGGIEVAGVGRGLCHPVEDKHVHRLNAPVAEEPYILTRTNLSVLRFGASCSRPSASGNGWLPNGAFRTAIWHTACVALCQVVDPVRAVCLGSSEGHSGDNVCDLLPVRWAGSGVIHRPVWRRMAGVLPWNAL